jgi:hypothetical protein
MLATRKGVTDGWRELNNEVLSNFYSSPNFVGDSTQGECDLRGI